jgi:HNH endonuclease
MPCSFCESPLYALGLCNAHYKKFKKYSDPLHKVKIRGSLAERFWPKVDRNAGDCWRWTGAVSSTGYGVIQEGGRGSRNLSAHRVAYEIANGPIEEGKVVMHSCDNRWCVKPAHLKLGTTSENIKDAYDKGRKVSPFAGKKMTAKLTMKHVATIRAFPLMKHTELAKMLGVSPNCIRSVRTGRTWKDSPP